MPASKRVAKAKGKGRVAKAEGKRQKAEHALEHAYRKTTYAAEIDGVAVAIRIGRRHRKLDAQLQSTRATTWACITAWNPRSQRLSAAENARRHASLKRALHRAGIRWHPMHATGDAGDWPTEKGVLALGIGRAAAKSLGSTFEQLAIVWGRVGEVAELVWCGRLAASPLAGVQSSKFKLSGFATTAAGAITRSVG